MINEVLIVKCCCTSFIFVPDNWNLSTSSLADLIKRFHEAER